MSKAVKTPTTKKKKSAAAVSQMLSSRGYDNQPYIEQRWEELEDLYHTTASNMLSVMAGIDELISNKEIINYVPNITAYTSALNGLTSDFNMLGDELVQIHNLHVGKTGVVKTDDELTECIDIYGKYTVFFEKFKGLTLPSVLSITDIAIEAQEKYKEANKSKEAVEVENV